MFRAYTCPEIDFLVKFTIFWKSPIFAMSGCHEPTRWDRKHWNPRRFLPKFQKLHFGRGHQLFGNMKLFTGSAPEGETWHEPWHNIRLQYKIVHRQIERRISCENSIRRSEKYRSAAATTVPSCPQDRYYSTANRSTSHFEECHILASFTSTAYYSTS